MNESRISQTGHAGTKALLALSQKLAVLGLLTLLVCSAIWLTNPGPAVQAQSACLLDCQGSLAACLDSNGTNCQGKYDDCSEACLMQ